jgi:hypothetical protein
MLWDQTTGLGNKATVCGAPHHGKGPDMMLNNPFKKVAIGAVAIATVITVPVVAQAKHTPIHQRTVVVHRHNAPGQAVASRWREPPYMSFQNQQLVTGD